MLLCCLLWSALTASFGAVVTLLARALEAALLRPFPLQHELGVWAAVIPSAGTVAVILLLRRRPGARVWADLLLLAAAMPIGVESPAMRLGTTFSLRYHFSEAEKEWLLICGVAAGFTGALGTPVAAVVFTLGFISARRPLPVIFAAIIGKAVHYGITGQPLVWPFGELQRTLPALPLFMLLGILTGLTAALAVHAAGWLRLLTARLRSHWWPVAGAVVVGLIAWYKPDAYGQGYERMGLILSVDNITLSLLISMSMYKLMALAAAKGTGMQGSVISPLLLTGASFGLLMALLLQLCFPAVPIHPPIAALAGAAAMLSGTTRCWLLAIVLPLEISGRLDAVLPVVLAALSGYVVSAPLLRKGAGK